MPLVSLEFMVRQPDANHPDGGYMPVSALNPLPVASSAGGVVAAASVTSQASSASVVTLLAANSARHGAVIVNTDANTLFIKYGTGATTAAGGWSYQIGSGVTWEMPWSLVYTGVITGIWAAAGAGLAEITEL